MGDVLEPGDEQKAVEGDLPVPVLPSMKVDAKLVYMATHVPLGIEEQDVDVVRMYGFGYSTAQIVEATGLSTKWCMALRRKYHPQVQEFAANKDVFMQTVMDQNIMEAIRLGNMSLMGLMRKGADQQSARDLKAIGEYMTSMMALREKLIPTRKPSQGRALTEAEEKAMVDALDPVGPDDAP